MIFTFSVTLYFEWLHRECMYVTLYIYCMIVREIWSFIPPWKIIFPGGKICFFIRYKSSYFRHNYAKKYMILLCKHTKIVLNPDSLNNTGASRGFTVQYRNVRVLGKCLEKNKPILQFVICNFFQTVTPRLILEP